MTRRSYEPDSLEEELAIMEEREEEDARVFELASLDTRIEELPLRPLLRLDGRATIAEAAAAMIEAHVGAIGVTAEDSVVGIFTERDLLVRVVAGGRDPRTTCLFEVMTPSPECLRTDDTLAFVAHEMLIEGFCHVPIGDVGGEVCHLVSLRDVVSYLLRPVEARISTTPPMPYHGELRMDVEYG